MTTYNWNCKTVDCYPEQDNEADVVYNVHWIVTGEKDAIDYKGDDDLQMLENSKLVPLLTAALQQAIDKIEALEQRIQLIENK